jgi:hypothetical protein
LIFCAIPLCVPVCDFFCGLQFLSFDALVCVKVGDSEDFRDHGQWTGVLDLILFVVEMKKENQ